jgi:multiple sugar transport system substrate-binding protein
MRKRNCAGLVALGAALATAVMGLPGSAIASAATGGVPLTGPTKGVTLTVMIATSGAAETAAVKTETSAWAKSTGNTVNVETPNNETQSLDEGFAGGAPPDIFYLSANSIETFAKEGDLLAYASDIAKPSDFYSTLVNADTYNHTWYCVPKDFANLALEINTTMWTAAGLTNADIPTNWAQLVYAAQKLTKGKVVGLDVGNTIDRLGAFMAENGGSYMNKAGTGFAFNSPQNIAALNWFVKYDKAGIFKLNSQQGAGWAGQAFGEGEAAMVTEGSWIIGGMASYPDIKWTAVPMPAGPTGIKGTLTFTDCWGVAAQTKYSKAAVRLVKYLTSASVETYNAKAFGPLPPRPAVAAAYAKSDPLLTAFIAGTPYAMPQVETVGWSTVQAAFDGQVTNMAEGSISPSALLNQLQTNAKALLQP